MNAKPLLIETIRIQNGRVRHIEYHNQRCNESRKVLFGTSDSIDLRKFIDTKQAKTTEVKCRITYDNTIQKIEYEAYQIRPIQSLKLVKANDLDYSHKYAHREELKCIFDQRQDKDDVLIVKNGLLTDTYYANIALEKNGLWYTPKTPLLKGTARARLIDKGKITPIDIPIDQYSSYNAISIFNAMIPFKTLVLNIQDNEIKR